jgi:peptidoglycan/LPS O-acetylase OafA/YrhL
MRGAARQPVALPARRDLAIDAIKGAACLLIVAHHLSVYGPMSDQAATLAPGVVGWLYDYGRWVVQVFLVIGGYLAAASLAPHPGRPAPPRRSAVALIWRRYCRLVLPYGVAVLASVLVAALIRPWFEHPSVPHAPSLVQALAHALLLQDVFGFEALSAGLWYVAIDFQLYALSVLVFLAAAAAGRRWPGHAVLRGDAVMLVLGAASLLVFNRNPALDITALYFVGAYVLGMLAYWAVPAPALTADASPLRLDRHRLGWLVAFGVIALAVAFRGRVALAWGVALALVALRLRVQAPLGACDLAQRTPTWRRLNDAPVRWLANVGGMSYSVFLIHFPVCLLVNAAMSSVWPTGAWPNALGLVAAMALSLAAGSVLFRWVEQTPAARQARIPLDVTPSSSLGEISTK